MKELTFMPLKTIIMILAIPVMIVVLFNLDIRKGSDTPEDGPAADEAEH